jgi:hypothetical protein
LLVGCRERTTGENDSKPPVNTSRPQAIVEPTNQVGVPLTNVPKTVTATNAK